jgi:hypothetical protein
MRVLTAISLLLCLVGCSATIVPPAHVIDPVPVFVTDYGRHSSLVLPDGDGHLVEYAWGDWDWFALEKTGVLDGIVAAFCSHGSALGTRRIDASPQSTDLAHVLKCEHLLRFDADRARVTDVLDALRARYQRHIDTQVYNRDVGLWLAHDDEHYAGWHNCNHVTAEWLRELGCCVEGTPFTSKFKLAPPACGPHTPPTTRPTRAALRSEPAPAQ